MTVLALDLSTHCGWAHDGPDEGKPFMGTKHLPSITGDKDRGHEFGPCADALFDFIWEKIDVVRPTTIAYEAPLPVQSKRMQQKDYIARMQFGMAWTVEQISWRRGIHCEEAKISDIKQFWTKNLRADKPTMMATCRAIGWAPVDDNAADAAALLARLRGGSRVRAAAALGAATPLLPCGPLYFLLSLALLSGSALRGAETLLAFGLGTVPLLWLAQANFHWVRARLGPRTLARLQGAFALAVAALLVWRLRGTLGLGGPGAAHLKPPTPPHFAPQLPTRSRP